MPTGGVGMGKGGKVSLLGAHGFAENFGRAFAHNAGINGFFFQQVFANLLAGNEHGPLLKAPFWASTAFTAITLPVKCISSAFK